MDSFRDKNLLNEKFSNIKIIEDYKNRKRYYFPEYRSESINLPSSDVIKICLENELWFAIRPSGTEPKLKIYYSTKAYNYEEAYNLMVLLKKNVNEIIVRDI